VSERKPLRLWWVSEQVTREEWAAMTEAEREAVGRWAEGPLAEALLTVPMPEDPEEEMWLLAGIRLTGGPKPGHDA
jgi:hypothetical protein